MNASNRFDSFLACARIAAIVFAACATTPALATGDFIYGDDYESSFVCPAGPTPAISGAMSPATISTALGTQNRYLVKVHSCGFSGNVTLTPYGAPASWTLTMDPPTISLALNAVAVALLTVSVPTDGDSGLHAVAVNASPSGANTIGLSADLDVAKEYPIHFAPDGTEYGAHVFLPTYLTIKIGTKLRYISDDTTSLHAIHAQSAAAGFSHQPDPGMAAGAEYDLTATGPVTNTLIYCHSHGTGVGQMYVTVVP